MELLAEFPTLSTAVAATVYVPSTCEAHAGMVALLVQMAAVLPVVPLWVVARLKAADCHARPVHYLLSELRGKVKVVVLAFTPTPPLLSAAVPVNVAGMGMGC